MIVHLTARAVSLPVPLTDPRVACWLWSRLRRAFPEVHACTLMPSHPHIITSTDDPELARAQLGGVLGGLRRSGGPGREIRWELLGPAQIVPDRKHLLRTVRYVALNPCRAGLVADPLEWPWSTYRDVVGAIADPWVEATRLAAALGLSPRRFAEEHHRYVSSDPSVSVAGTPFPRSAEPVELAVMPLGALVMAAAAATRGHPEDIRREGRARELFLCLAARHGWRCPKRLAAMCGIDRSTVRWRLRQRPDLLALAATELCLGDRRLRVWQVCAETARDRGRVAVATPAPRPLFPESENRGPGRGGTAPPILAFRE